MYQDRFIRSNEVHCYEIGSNGEATPIALLGYLEDAALSNTDAVGNGVESMKAAGAAWILNRWMLSVERYPSLGERITVATWPSSFERFYARREFTVLDADSKPLARASSLWIYLNTERKRPARIPGELAKVYCMRPDRALDMEFTDINAEVESEFEREFFVRRNDIDINLHVNNKKYVEWLLESVPDETYEGCRLKFLDAVYRQEINKGSVICSGCSTETSGSQEIGFAHMIRSSDGPVLFEARTRWEKV